MSDGKSLVVDIIHLWTGTLNILIKKHIYNNASNKRQKYIATTL